MSFTKENCFPVVPGLPSNTKTDQMSLVCSDPVCPTVSDPYTGRSVCRCYHLQEQTSNPQIYTTSGYPGLFPSTYSLDAQSTVTAPLQSSQLNPYATSMMNNAYQPQFIPQGTTMPQLDNILRSQVYNYMYPGVVDINSVARRKNATRETTSALKAWLQQHKKNPYPTKAEKIMLAIVTKMTLTQVSTWFANARRRLKKENKGEWSSDNSFDNVSDNESEDQENDSNKQNISLNLSGLNERHPTLHSTPIPNRVPEVPVEHTQSTHVHDRLPGFSTFTSYNIGQSQHSSGSPPLQLPTQCSTMSSLSYPTPLVSSASHLPDPYTMCQSYKYDNHLYTHTFPRTMHLDSEGDSNQNLSGSSSDDSDKENLQVTNSQTSNSCGNISDKKQMKSSPNVVSKSKIWSITEIIGSEKRADSIQDINKSVKQENSSATESVEVKNNIAS